MMLGAGFQVQAKLPHSYTSGEKQNYISEHTMVNS